MVGLQFFPKDHQYLGPRNLLLDFYLNVAMLIVLIYLIVEYLLFYFLLNLKILKTILYLILFSAAAFWGFKGDFLDFWDAFLWLVAFFFIELNLLKIGQPQTN